MSSDSMPFLDAFHTYEDDGDDVTFPVLTMQLPVSMPQTPGLGHENYGEMTNVHGASWDSSSSQPAVLPGQVSDEPSLNDEFQDYDELFAPFWQLPLPTTPTYQEGQRSLSSGIIDSDAGQNQAITVTEPLKSTPGVFTMQELGHARLEADVVAESVRSRRPRTQNHSCDPCRSGKKACDLRLSITIHNEKPSTPCSTCEVRGLDCKVAWLASRQSSQQIKKRARTSHRSPEAQTPSDGRARTEKRSGSVAPLPNSLIYVSTAEGDLMRQFTARETCLQQFNLYVDVVDMPLTECLSGGCMPPTFPLGLAALTPLSNSAHLLTYLKQAQSWIQDCWETKSTSWSSTGFAPHVFLAACLLDALFQEGYPQACRPSPAASRDASINETYKWVAMAAASQFVLGKDDERRKRARDLATATWHKAKQMVFNNIPATYSFRLALSMMLFGRILPPRPANEDTSSAEDAAYAFREGTRRLQKLCIQARTCLRGDSPSDTPPYGTGARSAEKKPHPVQMIPCEAQENVLELIGAVQWLVVIGNSVAIATSQGRICALSPQVRDNKAGCLLLTREIVPRPDDASGSTVAGRYEKGLHDSILTRMRAESHAVTALWRQGITEDVVINVISKSGSLVVLLFQALALLTLDTQNMPHDEAAYELIHRHLITIVTLINGWRSSFGKFDKTIAPLRIQQSGYQLRQFAFFCSNDGDLAVLLYYKVIERLEIELREHELSPAKERLCAAIGLSRASRKEERLTSAMQVSFLTSTARGLSSPGFGGKSGLKTYIEDIAAHPVSFIACYR